MSINFTLRDVPESLHVWIKTEAQRHHRSMNREIIMLLDDLRTRQQTTPRTKVDAARLKQLARRAATLPNLSKASEEEILGLDRKTGLPR